MKELALMENVTDAGSVKLSAGSEHKKLVHPFLPGNPPHWVQSPALASGNLPARFWFTNLLIYPHSSNFMTPWEPGGELRKL